MSSECTRCQLYQPFQCTCSLLQRIKQEEATKKPTIIQPEQKDIIVTSEMPKPLSPAEIQYVNDIKQMRAAEGL